MDKEEITERAISFLGKRYYALTVRTDDMLVFQDDLRDYDSFMLFILFVFFFIAPGILYYLLSPKRQITVSYATVNGDLVVTVSGNARQAKNIAQEFRDELTGKEPDDVIVSEGSDD